MRARVLRSWLLATVLLLGASSPPAAAALLQTHASEIVRDLRAGRPVVLAGHAIVGQLTLGGSDVVRAPFKCRECTFRGPMVASDVTFARTVDLSGSTFARRVDFRGAAFAAPALFRAAPGRSKAGEPTVRAARFLAPADFSLAFFEQFASFSGAIFEREAVFRDTRFADATFAGARFADAAFDRASFRGAALFNKTVFPGHAGFAETDFRGRAEFSLATFAAGADFTRSQFGASASFLASRFTSSPTSKGAATFQYATASGDLNFTFARFGRGPEASTTDAIAVFSDLVSGRSIVMREVEFADGHEVSMSRIQVRDLVLDVDLTDRIDREARTDVLELIEDSAKARGDLAVANDAHYERRKLESEDYGLLRRVFDVVVYRWIAGYFVRPVHPLVLLLVLGLLAGLLRALGSERIRRLWARLLRALGAGRSSDTAADEGPTAAPTEAGAGVLRATVRAPHAVGRALRSFLTGVFDSFALIVPGRDAQGEPAFHIRFETVVYRVLFVFGLLGLANSNPALREMLDTLF